MARPRADKDQQRRDALARAVEARKRRDLVGAARAYGDAVSLAPTDHATRREWALMLCLTGDRDRAVAEMRKCVAARPADHRWRYDLGDLLIRIGDTEEAIAHFERAAEMAPEEALYPGRLAALTWRLRRREEAVAWAERALAVDPAHPMAQLVVARSKLAAGDLDGAESMLRDLADGSPLKAIRANACHLLGVVLERRERWLDAFDAHQRGNDIVIDTPAAAQALRIPVDPFKEDYESAGAKELYARWGAERYDDGVPAPIVLTGFPRSGTTMVEQVLAAHPRITSADERPLLMGVMGRLWEMVGPPRARGELMGKLDGLTRDQVVELRGMYRSALVESVPEGERGLALVDKHPLRTIELGLMNRLFPESRIIVMIRDPRDVCLSALFQDFEVNPALARCLRADLVGDLYARVMGHWLAMRDLITLDWIEVRYETMVSEFETEAARVLEFIGEGWDDRVSRFDEHAAGRVILSASSDQVVEKLHTRSVARWRRYEARLDAVVERVAPFARAFGYDGGEA